MKKLLALLLALIMCLTVLTSCDAVKGVVDQIKDKIDSIIHPEEPVEYQIDKAEAFLKNMYKDVNPVTGADYEVVGQIRVANVAYTVTWASNTEEVKIVALENGNYLVDLDENSTKDVPYTLTATITAGNGDTATIVYERKVPDKTAALSWDEYMAAKKGDTVIVKGIVVAMNGKSGTNKYNHLYLADESGKGGYYAYKLTDEYDPIAAGVKVGMTVIVTGECSPYSGMQEIFGGTFTIVDETIKPVDPIDITEYVLAGNTDFSAYVALPVTIKGVTIGTQVLDVETSQYLNFSIGGLNSYIRTYVTDFPTTLTPDDKAAIDKAHADHFGYKADVTGIVVLYSGNPYLIPMSVDCFTNFTAVERTPEEKIAAELSVINLPANVGTATVVDLPLAGANYTDVAISWTSDSANAVVGTDGKLTISLADEATTVTLTATLTCGDKTVTETFEIAVAAKPNVVNVVVDAPVVGEEYYFMVYQANLGRNLFITGEMDGYYFATTSDIEAAVKVKVVDAGEGKYDLMVGDKYLGIVASGTYINVKYLDAAPENKFTWNTEYKTFTTTVNDTEYYFGTYNTFQTFSASKLSYAATSFVAHLIVVKNVGANVVDAPVVGNEYYFMTKQENLNKDLFITGEMNGYYFATTTDVTAAAKVKVVDAGEGKYDLMVGDKYLGIVASGTYINVKYLDAAPENKFTWNTEYKTFVTVVNDTEYYFGTYNTFETFSASKLSYAATSFVAHLIEWVEDPNAAPAHECASVCPACEKCTNADCTEDVCAEKCEGHVVNTAEAVALPDGTKVTVTGAVLRIDTAWSDQYGNITVTIGDAAGTLYVYRLATNVEVGQVITISGEVGSYKGAKQIAAGATATIDETHKHTFTEVKVDSTCVVAGTITYTCECGTTIVETLALAKHSANENSVWTTVEEAGCTTLGSEKTTCVVCGEADVLRDTPMVHTKDENGLCTVCNKWTFDATLDHGAMAAETKANGDTAVYGAFTIHYKSGTKVDKSSKTFEDGYTATLRLNMGGKSEVKDGLVCGAVSFTVTEATTLKVWWVCGGDARAIGLYTMGEDGKLVAPTTTYGADSVKNSLYITEIEVPAAGTYYLGATGSNYYFKLELDGPASSAPVVNTVTYSFANTSTQKGEELTAETALALFNSSATENVLTSVEVTKIYDGNGTGGAYPETSGFLKAGSSKADGQIVLNFGDKKVTKVEIKCHDWYKLSDAYPTNSNKISVNGSEGVLVPYTADGTPDVITFTLDEASSVVTIDIARRAFIFDIVVTFE